jgi:hypothetical protein
MANPPLRRAAAGVVLNPALRRWFRRPGGFSLRFDYDYDLQARYGYGRQLHPRLLQLISKNEARYDEFLRLMASFNDNFKTIDANLKPGMEPAWDNGWLPPVDGMAIYTLLASRKPTLYLEVGSGNSTKFAYRAKRDHGLSTKLISIDPHPRAEIDQVCDEIVRSPLEHADLSVFRELQNGDVLFIDNSHRAFMNSDATVFFLDILPNLKKGVVVGVHDICLPYDYPPTWKYRYYNEQYLLASYLLAERSGLDVLLPSYYLSLARNETFDVFRPVFDSFASRKIERHGCAFWFVVGG